MLKILELSACETEIRHIEMLKILELSAYETK